MRPFMLTPSDKYVQLANKQNTPNISLANIQVQNLNLQTLQKLVNANSQASSQCFGSWI